MVDLNGQLRLHDRCRMKEIRVGAERRPVLIIDDFLSSPDVLIEYAVSHGAFEGVSDTFYPGGRSPIPAIYCFAIRTFLGQAIAQSFGLRHCSVAGELSHFSLVTTRPEDLRLVQRLPHFDSTDPRQIAVLHFLCDPAFGGTSFYRHRRTGFEYIDSGRNDAYSKALREDLATLGEPQCRYICGDDARFERTESCAAAFNRVIAYQGINLHSADIHSDFKFSEDPRAGRLTANSFFFYR